MRAYMKPRMRPSSRTWGKMPIRSGKSIGPQPKAASSGGAGSTAPPADNGGGVRLLFRLGGGDGQLLDDLVVPPLLGIVARDLEHEVLRFLTIALAIEGDFACDAGELGLAYRRRYVFSTHLAALGDLLDSV